MPGEPEIIDLAGDILPGANVNVLSDVAVAAGSARAALDAAVVNVEVNLAALREGAHRTALDDRLATCSAFGVKAEEVVRAVRARITR